MVTDSRNHGQEIIGLAKRAALNRLEDLVQVRVDRVRAVRVCVAKVLDILGEVAEEEYIVLANFTRNLNLWQCQLLCYVRGDSLFQRLRLHRHTCR